MNKKSITLSVICILILFILFASFKLIIEPSIERNYIEPDKTSMVKIDDKELKVTYKEGDTLDVSLTYGNIYTKIINISNDNDQDVTYSLKYTDSNISNDLITYEAFVSYNGVDYTSVLNNKKLIANSSLLHNIVIPKKSDMSIKVVFKSNMENTETIIKGKVVISTNLSTLELYNTTIRNITEALDKKVEDLNGISVKGYYLLNIKDLSFNNGANVSGYILVDSTDISDIKYIYTIFNNKYLIKNTSISDMNIINVDNEYVSSLNKDVICHQYDTRIKCDNFSSIPKNSVNNKQEFFNNIKVVIDEYKNMEINDNNNYIYNINKNNIVGYILLNKNDMFIYLRNDMFMVSGYNYKKLGDFDIKSKAIRTYNESAFNLSASDFNKVCEFSGFNNCIEGK
ncbi:MAG: hypothetical protein IKP76_01545 [Bacilli bacterium]|nr:hypothetical protein [Bacilli bacterium]